MSLNLLALDFGVKARHSAEFIEVEEDA